LEKSLDTSLQTLNNLYDSAKVLTPAKSRQMYDKLSNAIEGKVNELNGLKNDLNNAIISINNSMDKLNECYGIIEKIQQYLNKGRVGTLEGITRVGVEKGYKTGLFPVENFNELEKEVLNQKYDELKQLNFGG
jgi:hypothetical protein